MQNKNLQIVLALGLLILLGFSGCRKYQEGPLLSIRTVKKRLEGNYALTEFTVNGVNRTQELINDPGYCPGLTIERYNGRNQKILVFNCDTNYATISFHGSSYSFSKYKRSILLSSLNPYITADYECFKTTNEEFDITRLTLEDFWIQINIDGNQYGIKYLKT